METGIEIYSPEWFKDRQGSFTGSEVWKLMTEPRSKKESISKTAETYILEKVWERLSGKCKSGFDNFATEWGNDNEPIAKKWYTKLTGREIQESQLVFRPELKGFTGSPDGEVDEDGLIEIKCPFNGANHLKHCFITSDEYFKAEHPDYYWQIMSYLYLTGRQWCDFVSFDPRIDCDLGMFIYRVNKNETEEALLVSKIEQARVLFDQYYNSFSGKNGN
jgi:putative phage-type endonuclease